MTNPQKLNQLLQGLSPAKQQIVEEFIQALAKDARPTPTFRQALDQFKRTHPELLRLLSRYPLSVRGRDPPNSCGDAPRLWPPRRHL
jgi:hypothetical protein